MEVASTQLEVMSMNDAKLIGFGLLDILVPLAILCLSFLALAGALTLIEHIPYF